MCLVCRYVRLIADMSYYCVTTVLLKGNIIVSVRGGVTVQYSSEKFDKPFKARICDLSKCKSLFLKHNTRSISLWDLDRNQTISKRIILHISV